MKKPLLIAVLVIMCFWVYLPQIGGEIFIDSPQNTSYNVSEIWINVSTNTSAVQAWFYSDNGGPNVTFTPNITVNFSGGIHVLTIYNNYSVGQAEQGYGSGSYSNGTYGRSATTLSFFVQSNSVTFTVLLKRFLMEIYIMFEIFAAYLLLRGFQRKDVLVYPLLAMILFFTLAVTGGYVEQIVDYVGYVSYPGIYFNWALGWIAFIHVIFISISKLRILQGEKDVMAEI